MAGKCFNIVFSGRLVDGREPQQVLARLSEVLKLEPGKVRELFRGGNGAVILKELDSKQAYMMQENIREAGAICSVREVDPPPPPEPLSGIMLTVDTLPPERPAVQSAPTPPRQDPRLQSRLQPPPVSPKQGPGIISRLFWLIVIAAIAVAGWWGYQNYLAPPTPAFQAYSQFAEAMARGDYGKARDLSTGAASEYAESWISMYKPTSIKVYGKDLNTTPPSVSSIAGDIAWIKHKRKAERTADNGQKAILEVEQTVCRIPPGVSSAICKWPVTFRHEVEVQMMDGTWKVAQFKEERLTPQQ